MAFVQRLLVGILIGVVALMSVGCGGDYIRSENIYTDDPGFQIEEDAEIPDTTVNRQVLDVLAHYRRAIVNKDFGALKRLVSDDYYDNAGTTDTTQDDYSADKLPEIFELMAQHAEDIQYDVEVQNVDIRKDRAFVSYEFDYAYKYNIAGDSAWDAGVDVNRLELVQEDGKWRIISGM